MSNMDEIKSRTMLLKLKLIDYENEYLRRRNITKITPEIKSKMIKSTSRRLKNEINELDELQNEIRRLARDRD